MTTTQPDPIDPDLAAAIKALPEHPEPSPIPARRAAERLFKPDEDPYAVLGGERG